MSIESNSSWMIGLLITMIIPALFVLGIGVVVGWLIWG